MTPMPGLEFLLTRLRQMRRHALAFEWLTNLGWMVALLSVAFVAAALTSAFTIPSSVIRVSVLSALAVAVLALFVWGIAKSTIWSPRDQRLALVRCESSHVATPPGPASSRPCSCRSPSRRSRSDEQGNDPVEH